MASYPWRLHADRSAYALPSDNPAHLIAHHVDSVLSASAPGSLRCMRSSADIASGMRQALRRLAKAVAVITAYHRERRFAMSATAVSELAIDPPSMLVCVNRSASIYSPLQAGASFGINILRASHEPISRACSGAAKGEARFEVGSWLQASNDVPYLSDAQATLICANATSLPYGSHCIFIGRVIEVFYDDAVDPLIYADGQYRSIAAQRKQDPRG